MDAHNKQARDFLKSCTRREYDNAVNESMLTDTEMEAVRLHIKERKNLMLVGDVLSMGERTVKNVLRSAYGKIWRAVNGAD